MFPNLDDLKELARGAGQILKEGYSQEFAVHHKGRIDLVTDVDHRSEAFLLEKIQRRFPAHTILAEESGRLVGESEACWYIDPLDGTVNFAHGVPVFCVSLGFAKDGLVQLGVVYDPLRDEMFSAERGQGAHLNGRPIRVSQVTELLHSLLATGFAYQEWITEQNLPHFGRFSRLTQGVRRLGSAAIDLCYVAAGRLEGYWEISLSPWDLAAGGLIVQEAGGRMTRADGEEDFLHPPTSALAANPQLHAQMLEILLEGKHDLIP
jgi:myo-inositol-1(or 4)-monophosphatase